MKGYFSEEALELYANLAAEKAGIDFAEGEVYDFTRCMRSDGTFYGTAGKCRQGSETGAKEKEAPKRTGRLNKEKQWSPPVGGKRPPENPTAEQITKMSKDELWNGKAAYKPGTAGHQAYKNEIERRRDLEEKLKARGVEPQSAPKATSQKASKEAKEEYKAAWDEAKAARKAANEAVKNYKQHTEMLKEATGMSPAQKRKVLQKLITEANKADRAAAKAERKRDAAAKRWATADKREQRAKMSPDQLKEARRIDKIIKEQG
jgi:hypothetical protein